MSTLQISLAIIGGLVLAGVVAYNAWVTSKNAPRTASERPGLDGAGEPQSFESPLTGPVIEPDHDGISERIEPVMGHPFEPAPEPEPQVVVDGEARVPVVVPVTLNNVVSPPEKRPGLDALIDVITPLAIEGPVSGDALLAALPGTRRVGSKPFAVEGLNETSGEWESPRLGQRYRALQAGVQLANRSGPLNDIEFSEFVVKAQAFADAVGAAPEFPDMRAEVARARELDAFASGHDAQLGFTLRARRAARSPG